MRSYLIIFKNEMIDLQDGLAKAWLRKISMSGLLLSIDQVEKSNQAEGYPMKGFAIMSSKSDEEVNSILLECPGLNFNDVLIYPLV